MKSQLLRFTCCGKCHEANTITKTNHPTRGKERLPPELFTHNPTLAHMKQTKKMSRLARLSALLFRCVFVVLMGVIVLITSNTVHAVTFVSNFDQPYTWVHKERRVNDLGLSTEITTNVPYAIWVDGGLAQGFRTGSNESGYNVSSVEIHIGKADRDLMVIPSSVSLWSSSGGAPKSLLYTFTLLPDSFVAGFSLASIKFESNAILESDTSYFIVIKSSEQSRITITSSSAEDAGSLAGWSIRNTLMGKDGDHWRFMHREDVGSVFPEGAGVTPALRIGIQGFLLDSRSIIVSLTQVGEGQFKATRTTSVPFDIVLPITVVNGTIVDGATTVTIPSGSRESDVINVSRTPSTTFPVSVDIGNLPSPPAGYALFKSQSHLPLQVIDRLSGGPTPVGERTPQVRDAIMQITGVSAAYEVTEAHLARITTLGINNPSGAASTFIGFKQGDFSGLTTLTTLEMNGHGGVSLPDGIFDGLTSLKNFSLYSTGLTSIPDAVLGLTSLTRLNLGFTGVILPNGVFDRLTSLTSLDLSGNSYTSLPAGVFDQLTSLIYLNLEYNDLTSLPDGVFDNLTSLTRLNLDGLELTSLPAGVFDRLTSLTSLSMRDSLLSSLSGDDFSGLPGLTYLNLSGSRLTSLSAGIFSGLSSLTSLHLERNTTDPLPLTVSLEKVGERQFKAVTPTGAPFDIVLPLNVRNGSISGRANTLTIPTGSVESASLTVTRTPGTSAAVTLDIGTLPGLPTDVNQYGALLHQGYTLVKSNDLPLVAISRLASGITPVSERTSQVRDAIVAAVPGINSADDVTEAHLAAITVLNLNGRNITALKVGDFDGLTSLEELRLYNNQLTTLPADLFDGLTTLTTLRLYGNQLSTLPEDIFDELIGLTMLQLGYNRFATLPGSIFDGLTKLTDLRMIGNQFTTLPEGIFDGLTTLTTLYLGGNAVNPLPLTVSLEKIGEEQFKATAPTGAPFDIVLPLNIANGTTDNGATTLSIPKGSVESEPLTVLRTSATAFTVTVDIGTLPGLPSNHSGYSLAKSNNLPLRFTELDPVFTPLSERTPQVRDQIVLLTRAKFQFQGVNSVNDVTPAHLRSITTSLDLRNKSITSLKAGDFSGLSSLEKLILDQNSISSLPEEVFEGLSALKELWIQANALTSLPAGVFDGLSRLEKLQLASNALTSLPEDVFDGLSNLTTLDLHNNSLSSLPEDVFEGLSLLTSLRLSTNALTSLPEDVFDGLSNLTTLNLHNNSLNSLPEEVFDGLSALTTLNLSSNALTSLPMGVFVGLSNLTSLSMHSNSASLFVTVSLQKVGEDQFKAVAPTGAPFDIVLPLSVANGSVTGGATTITIPAGSVESELLAVTRTPSTTAVVTVDIGTLPGRPSGHFDYRLVKSDALPLEVISSDATTTATGTVTIPDPNLRAKIETALGKTSGDPITATEMATLTSLSAQDAGIRNLTGLEAATNLTSLHLGNNSVSDISALAGLTSLTELQLWDNTITNISAVAGLTNLTKLYLWGNAISDISAVAGLTNLTHLRLGENSISNISAVAGLTNLTHLNVRENSISNISAVAGLTNLTELLIGNNSISDITPVQNLINLAWLDMPNNSISDISSVQNLTQLVELYFQNNAVSDLLPLVANTGLGTDDELDIRGNPLSYPSIYTHIPALQARDVYIDFDNRVATASLKISGDTQQGAPSTALANPLVVEVQDANSVVFAGVPVTFAVTAGGGTLSVTSTATNTNGRAESTLILGSSAGTNTVRVSVQGVSQAATFTAEAATTNIAPVFTDGTSTTRAIAENTAAGINIGATIAATDANNDTLTYTLGGTDAASFAIDSTTGQLKTQAALDYETKSSYSVTVSVSDDNGGSDSITVTINVTDVDEQRTEQTDVTTYEAGDEIPLPSGFNTPRLTMGPGRSLTADNGTYTCVSEDNCIIQNGQVTQGTIEVTTVAANTAPMFTDGTSTTRSIAENTAAGVSIGTAITATDTNNDILTYTLSGTDANAFNIERTTGQLKTSAPLDYETKRSYTVTVTVSDGSLTDTITATINVSDIAETPANTGVCEVGDILSPGESCTYPGTDAEFSVLNNGNGQFLFFSSGNSLNIRNTTINGVSYTLVANKLASGSWEIEEIGDSAETRGTTNSAPVFTDGTSTTRSVAENTSANVNIGNAVAATDPENDTLTYTLSGTDAASFDIESTTGQLKTKSALDYETKSAYTVTITVSDSNLTDTINVTINVTNIAETSTATTAINIPDNNLRAKIEAALGKASGAPISAAEMETLTSLTAQDASISNLTGLEAAMNLTILKLGDNSVSDISPLTGLTKLTELQLWDNAISNISAVAGLTQVTRLYLWGNTISNISPVASLTNLTQLRLGENSISNISALAGLTSLTFLSVKENSISDISAVVGLTNLTELRIGNNAITNISAVAKLTNLVWLDAPNNSISDISAVANLTNLTSLMLTGNTISDISTLTGLTKLIELYLGENSILDLSPLVANTGLGADDELDIRGNPLSYPSIYTHIPALQARNVYIDFDNRTPTAPTKISGDTQQGSPGTTLAHPFVVEVQDGDSATFAGVPVTFAVTAGGGTLSVTSTTTNTNGRAESTLILGSSAGTNTVRVSVQGVSQAATFTAEATTTNTAPVFTEGASTTRTIAENTAAGVNIGTAVAATDANNDTLTYTLGGTDAASFSISSSTGQLQTKSALDYETKTVYTVTVTVSDGTLTDSITVTINITDVAETPANTGVCQVGDVLAPGESCTYPSTAATFSVHNNGNGQFLFFTSGSNLNIKNTVINGQSYTLVANKLASGSWKIEEIADSAAPATTNTAPVFTEGASTTRTIAENTAAGVNIGTAVAATDADNDTLTYTLGGTDASAFDIDSTTGQLRTRATLDYETKRAYNVSVSVSDGTLTDTITVTIAVTDVNDTAIVSTLTPVCDRTTQVRDAIVAAVSGVSDCNDVTEAHLAAITRLDLENKNISSLKDGDFDGMTALYELRLQNNRLQTLPANIFSGLSSLRTLYLNNNRLSSLPSTVFSGLSSLSNLYMNNNKLTSLPETVFSGLTSLRQINMHTNLLTTLPVNVFSGLSSLNQISINNNRLISLPENVFSGRTGLIYLYLDGNRLTSLPANLFSGLSKLEQLKFNHNRLSSLPAGLFSGLSSLTWLLIHNNTVNPLPFTVSLEKVGTNQFKATAPVGAPFTMTLPLLVENGSISGGASTLTIQAGNVESQSLTVTRTPGTTDAVTVDFGNPLPGLPTNHQGYQLVKSSTLPLTIFNALSNNAPIFTDGTSATRTIAENTASGVNIGSPVSATDANNDTLTYSLSGTDAASFDIDTTNGQLQTQAALDYETKSSYTVTVTVSDGDLTDTITVTINITDIDESPTDTGVCKVGDILAPGESCTYPGTDATFSVLDNGSSQWNIPDLPAWLAWANQVSIGGSLSFSATINDDNYHFVTEEVPNDSWEIKEIGEDRPEQPETPETPETPEQPGDVGGTPTLTTSTTAPLTETTLDESVVTLTLSGGTYHTNWGVLSQRVTVSGIDGVIVQVFNIERVSDTEVTVELTFDDTDFDTNSTLTFTVGAGAIANYDGTALTAQVPVTANTESVVASTTSPLTEDTLDGSVVTLTLSGRTYESSGVRIRNGVTVSGISGVTVGTFDIDRVSDTQVTVELTFNIRPLQGTSAPIVR